jgi:hypothetical protein
MHSYGTTWHISLALALLGVTGLLGCSSSHGAGGSPDPDAGGGGAPVDSGTAPDAGTPPDASSDAPDGGTTAPWRTCEQNGQCVLAADGCCASCGQPSLESRDPINREFSMQHYEAVCDQEEPVDCPACEPPPAPHLGATCTEGLCEGFNIRTMELTACETNDQCRLRARSCCECGSDFNAHNLIAIREGRSADYTALVCTANTSCGQCGVQYPTDRFSAVCAPDGHCDVAYVADSP